MIVLRAFLLIFVKYVQAIQQTKLRLVQDSFGDTKADQRSLKEARLQVSILFRIILKLQPERGLILYKKLSLLLA